ncbi:hypothetical protein JVU11DRAFT_3883 [Chiua virens]|nr:hypothetical protein JVU11DRAFT_3883 [Chiua virens]
MSMNHTLSEKMLYIIMIHLIGNSVITESEFVGTGKTTLGVYLSAKLNLPHISLDELAWKPGWQDTPIDEFKEKVGACMAQNTRGWIMDGHHPKALGTLVADSATDIICEFDSARFVTVL